MLKSDALVSVVIPNFNYARFLGEAIESALALDWPRVEVIVVDDGSTDASREVIESFGQRVSTVFQCNAGHASACRAGFDRSGGEVVFLLDSDDLLAPGIVRALAPVWLPSTSKVQFQMKVVDGLGRPLGSVLPQFITRPSPASIREWVLRCAAYPTPPGSGNAYARWFLQRVLPQSERVDRFADSSLLTAAPLLGDVMTIAEPLVSYRLHGANDGAMNQLDVLRPGRELARAFSRFRYAQQVAQEAGLDLPDGVFGRGLSLGVYRASSLCLTPATHPMAGDTRWRVVADAWRGAFVGQGLSFSARIALVLLICAVCIVPPSLACKLVEWRLVPTTRPLLLRRGLQFARAIR